MSEPVSFCLFLAFSAAVCRAFAWEEACKRSAEEVGGKSKRTLPFGKVRLHISAAQNVNCSGAELKEAKVAEAKARLEYAGMQARG